MEAHNAHGYSAPSDRQYARDLRLAAPNEFGDYSAFTQNTLNRADGAVPVKYRELIAIAVALTTQCPYCLETHTAAAVKAEATKEELAEVVYIAAALRAGAAAAHGLLAMKLFTEAQNRNSVNH